MKPLHELSSKYLTDPKAMKRLEKQEKDNTERDARMKHGKRYKDFISDKGKKSETRTLTKKGVRALHKGKWGYMKDRKFTPD
jgi:hypothetical protein